MGLEGHVAVIVAGSIDVIHVVLEGHLGVDEDAAVFGQADDGVGLGAAAVGIGDADLEVEISPLFEPGGLQQAFEGEFSPVAEQLVVAAQGLGEGIGLEADVAALLRKEFNLLLEGAALLGVGEMDILDLLAEVGDLDAEGVEENREGLAVLGGEFLRLGVEDLVGEDLEAVGEFLAGGGEGVEAFLEADGVGTGVGQAGDGAEVGDGVTEEEAREKGDQDIGGGHGNELAAAGGGKQVKEGIPTSNVQ